MRIGAADSFYDSYVGSISAAANANPTPTGTYTVVHDYSLKVNAAATTEQVSVTSAGLATYVSDKALDYTGLDVKAYKAKVNGTKISFTEVTTVPAGEGVLLQMDGGGTFEVPVATGVSTWADEDNDFIRGTGENVPTDAGNGLQNYILNNVDGEVGFYRANNQKVATNRAYLQSTAETARIAIVIEDSGIATAIEAAEIFGQATGIYDLQGRRVEKPAKGLYIMNGKKVIIK